MSHKKTRKKKCKGPKVKTHLAGSKKQGDQCDCSRVTERERNRKSIEKSRQGARLYRIL